ncbi:MAG: fasciclin domain-containing protein [Prevotella sp.]|nr:fasciclin domain-containing protein [Prevotella sp.]
MRYINKIGVMLTAGLMLAAASCTDYSDYNTEPSAGDMPGANQTLWENISSDAQLTKFANLAKKSNFVDVLNSPRFYTLWAPVDDAISDAEYNALMASDSATIVKQFMQHHMTEYNYPISAALESTTIVSLNAKHHPFTKESFDGISYSATNLPSTNGVMHKINGLSEFHQNLYENIDNMVDCDSLKAYIQKYDEYYLDLNASVIGPLRDGKQTYLDSVMKKRNNVISRIMNAELENEDSSYCMLLPNNKAWRDAYAAINPHYNYIPKLDYMDLSLKNAAVSTTTPATNWKAATPAEADTELQDSLTRRNIVKNLVFSNCYQRNLPLFGVGSFAPNDTAVTTGGSYHVNMQEVLNHTTAINEMSNGLARTIDSLTFRATSYNPVISTMRPDATQKVKKLTSHSIPLDSLKGRDSLFSKVPPMFMQWLKPADSRFFTYVAVDSANIDGSTGKPEFSFAFGNRNNNGNTITGQVRSSTYHIYVVTVPAQVEDPLAAVKPYYLRFYLSWTDASNKQQFTVLPEGSRTTSAISTDFEPAKPESNTVYVGDPGRINVIDLGEFTFPVCYYGLEAYPSLTMIHTKTYTSSSNRSKYDQQMRVAGVYLVPKEYNDMWANSQNE